MHVARSFFLASLPGGPVPPLAAGFTTRVAHEFMHRRNSRKTRDLIVRRRQGMDHREQSHGSKS